MACLLLAACGSDSAPPSGNGQGTGGGTGGSGTGGSSDIPTGCTNGVQASSFPEFTQGDPSGTKVQRLGTRTVGDQVDFTIPEGTVSFTIVEQAVSAPLSISGTVNGSSFTIDNTAVPFRVFDPGSNVFFDYNTALPDDLSTERLVFLSSAPGTGTLTAPNTSAGLSLVAGGGFTPGAWSVVVSDLAYLCAVLLPSPSLDCSGSGEESSTYDVSVITKEAGGHIPTAGAIDLAIYFATPDEFGLSEASASGDRDLTRMVSTLREIYGAAGITLNDPTFHDLPADVRAPYATGVDVDQEGACSPLAQLLKNALPGNALSIFLVSRLTSSEGDTVGVDGTIPGPSSVGGTVASGAAVSAEDLRSGSDTPLCSGAPRFLNSQDDGCGADNTAYILAHEAGHFLGLYHTTEALGRDFDPLADTETCPCATCTTRASTCGTHRMSLSECAPPTARSGCGGGDNLMFYVLSRGASATLEPEQAQVMLANPLVHP